MITNRFAIESVRKIKIKCCALKGVIKFHQTSVINKMPLICIQEKCGFLFSKQLLYKKILTDIDM
jgi:hypothetical protein